MEDADADRREALMKALKVITFVGKSGLQRTKSLDTSCDSFRYVPATRLVYLSRDNGLDVLRPGTGALIYRLDIGEDPCDEVSPVDVKDKMIYALTMNGSIYALRHPEGIS